MVIAGQPVDVVDMVELVPIDVEYCADTPIAAKSESAINATNRAVILFFIYYLLFVDWGSRPPSVINLFVCGNILSVLYPH